MADELELIETEQGIAADLIVQIPHGIHSRPSAKIAQIAREYAGDVLLITKDGEADAKSMLNILSLAIPCRASVRLLAKGPDAAQAVERIGAILTECSPWPGQ